MQITHEKNLSIIIVTTNEIGLLRDCVNSIIQTVKNISCELIIINNRSDDGTKKYLSHLKTPFPLKRITNTKIDGFATNCNKGIKKSSGKYLLLLNPDTRLQTRAVQHLLSFMRTHRSAGICAPKLLNPDGSLQYSFRRFPTWKSFIVRRTPIRVFFPNSKINNAHLMKQVNHEVVQKVDWVLGGCMCIRKKTIETIGLLDSKYYLYVDDIDFCFRSWKAGWEVWYVPTAKVVHYHQAKSDKALLNIYSLYHIKSMIHFLCKHGFILNRKKRYML
ncbi:MAG: glycosyltransferase family 2 protein [Microgenomates group bacterium]